MEAFRVIADTKREDKQIRKHIAVAWIPAVNRAPFTCIQAARLPANPFARVCTWMEAKSIPRRARWVRFLIEVGEVFFSNLSFTPVLMRAGTLCKIRQPGGPRNTSAAWTMHLS